MTETKQAGAGRVVAECWTCACDGPPFCTMPHAEGDSGRMPYRLTQTRLALHKSHDVRPVAADKRED